MRYFNLFSKTMTKKRFIKLLKKAKQDENGHFYIIEGFMFGGKLDESMDKRVYFGLLTTACDDFVETYCHQEKDKTTRYDRHFTLNDDTCEIIIVRN